MQKSSCRLEPNVCPYRQEHLHISSALLPLSSIPCNSQQRQAEAAIKHSHKNQRCQDWQYISEDAIHICRV